MKTTAFLSIFSTYLKEQLLHLRKRIISKKSKLNFNLKFTILSQPKRAKNLQVKEGANKEKQETDYPYIQCAQSLKWSLQKITDKWTNRGVTNSVAHKIKIQ